MVNQKVSIIIPVYNGEAFLRQSIESALNQTYSNIEVIVVNDGSTDDTEQIALSYKDKIKYFYKENGGVASALNLGIEEMEGEYFSWLSHDDLYKKDKIKNQIDFINDNTLDENVILFGGYTYITKHGRIIQSINLNKLFPDERINDSLFCVFFGEANGCTMLIHRNLFNKYGMFNESLKTTQDYDLWYRMIKNVEIRYTFTNDVLMRLHDMQGSRKINHSIESNRFWSFIIKDVDFESMIKIKGNPIYFIDQLKKYLNSSGSVSDEISNLLVQKRKEILAEIEKMKQSDDYYVHNFAKSLEISKEYFIDKNYRMRYNFKFKLYNTILMIKKNGIKYTFFKILKILKQKVDR